jgi:hypothetical protein
MEKEDYRKDLCGFYQKQILRKILLLYIKMWIKYFLQGFEEENNKKFAFYGIIKALKLFGPEIQRT